MSSVKKINIQSLNQTERINLAEELWDSVANNQDEIAVTNAQKNVIEERLAAYKSSPSDGHSWEDVKNEMK